MWIPPLILAILGFVFGVFPGNCRRLHHFAYCKHCSRRQLVDFQLKIWHGFNTVLILSLVTLALGTLVYLVNKPDARKLSMVERFNFLSPQAFYSRLLAATYDFSTWYSDLMHNGFLRSYLLKIIIFAELLLGYELIIGGPIYIDYSKLSPISIYEGSIVLILIAAVYLTITTTSRLSAVVGTSVIGYAICLIFVYYSAPDLAMTQFTIDTLTVVLFVFVLFNLPSFLNFARNRTAKIRDSVVAIVFGTILSLIAIKVLQVPTKIDISDFYGEFAYTLAKGKNVVNVILVDFRGFDTMFEIVVLSIAALGVYSLIKLRLKASEKE